MREWLGLRFRTDEGFFTVIAAVEGFPNLEQFVKISRHGVLNEVIGSASALL